MSARDDLLEQLSTDYDLVAAGPDAFHMVGDREDALERPIRLELEEHLFEEYVDRLSRTGGEPDARGAVGLVRVHVDEAVQSSIALGEPLVVLGVRRSGLPRRARWFEERTRATGRRSSGGGSGLEWRP